ncbi:hypothetical protein B296_00019186 [Ensete ventricosum]|uniref:Uncharacterized protein n=1 Tax=Ensete ventricosum TaxID=4639 RepID=A0A427AMQ9_ENSVE|nr:hypothetical protein B296_00019186 [Ensete ventricosum]
MRELCHTPIVDKDEGYHALRMIDLPPRDPDAPMVTRWSTLKNSSKVWLDGASSVEYEWGVLLPHLVFNMYASPSEVPIERAMKSLVLVISVMDNRIDGLHREIEELKVGSGPEAIAVVEQHVVDFQAESQSYRVALAQFWARYPDLEVKENPFTILPENSNILIEASIDHIVPSSSSPDVSSDDFVHGECVVLLVVEDVVNLVMFDLERIYFRRVDGQFMELCHPGWASIRVECRGQPH